MLYAFRILSAKNARLFAAMANRREVRERLAEQGIRIPDDTWFIPALHDTTTSTNCRLAA